ncbi:hypothetical protein LAZ67_7002525 [Cordylochernes scorpioides]|uniref:Uncharacterized protein n=1 Tax=Cordylochernes scorpioides TaxID=51811 RepID=A0ABY6KN95_9ARAC|nr:hypothetical protein LAZ67_7002525 [Cordylochernes scorpioides]
MPAEPTPPAPHREDSRPAIVTPPPPLPVPMEEDLMEKHWKAAGDILYGLICEPDSGPMSQSGICMGDVVEAALYPEDREHFLRRLSPGKKNILAGFIDAAIERARDSDPFLLQFVSLPDCTTEEHLDGIAEVIGWTGIHSIGKINGQAIVSVAGVEQAEMLINAGFQVKGKTIYPYPLFNIPKKYILSGVMLFIPDEEIIKALQPYGQALSVRPLPFPTNNPLYKHLSSLRREIIFKKKEDTAMPAVITIDYMGNNFKIFVAEDLI